MDTHRFPITASFYALSERKSKLFIQILDTFVKQTRKATVAFVMPIRPSIHMEQLGSHGTIFREISYWTLTLNLSARFRFG